MLDINRILRTLPHRFPFLLVDRILEMEPGKRAVGIKNVTFNEPFFQGHWPEMPVMPGVLLIEAMAQVGGVLLLAQADNEGKQAYIGGVDKVRFRRRVIPGDQLLIEVDIHKVKGDIGRVKATAKVDDEIAAEGFFMFALTPLEPDELPE
jgi:3-hydroxyacyl-[acyl-carrier-protein] dehydratase